MFTALGLVLFSAPRAFVRASSELPALSLLALLLMALVHLFFDVPRYGWYAVRDASAFLEAIFFPLGIVWGMEDRSVTTLLKWLMFLFVANLAYSLSYPWAEGLQYWSPKSGIFLVLPVLGFYAHNYLYLLAGALFCLWLGSYVVRWPRWCLILLAMGQLFELAVHQARSMYVGVAVVLLLLILLGEFGKLVKIGAALATASVVLLLLTSLAGLQLQGRVGPVNAAFLDEHVRSLFLVPGTPAVGSIYSREQWNDEVWQRIQSSTANILEGEGFGKPLIDFENATGEQVRQPHDTHLTVLARLGIFGLISWSLFHLSVVSRFLRALRDRKASKKSHDFTLWFFAFYILSLIVTTVQPHLEFSFGAIPFYFLIGFAIGALRGLPKDAPSLPRT
jgi:hypothetical protein